MNAILVLGIALIALLCGYLFYGKWLADQWGINDNEETPAHSMEDGLDYVPAKPYVLIGHHFSSIAGAGPVNGPIQAAVFGWVPVLLWVIIGGIFFGAAHDFGALFSSIKNKGRSISSIVEDTIGISAKRLFCIFSFMTIILTIAVFSSIVAQTFAVFPNVTTGEIDINSVENLANRRTAMISLLFIVFAIGWGFITRGRKIPTIINILSAIVLIVVIVILGYQFPILSLDSNTWIIIIGLYIIVASVAPVWILLQPRDYLSSFLLYGMLLLAFFAIIGASLSGATSHLSIPAFNSFYVSNTAIDTNGNPLLNPTTGTAIINKAAASGFLFPALFITIACGAISGFHSLVSSGTTSKQLDKASHAKPIAYGSMLIECVLAVISLCAVAFVWTQYQAGEFSSPSIVFAKGISGMVESIPGLNSQDFINVIYALLILAISTFCLTTLDTATRIGRMIFQELLLNKDETAQDLTGIRKVLYNPYVATLFTVLLGIILGIDGYNIIWPLFGAANQLLAALALLAISAFLKSISRNNKMLIIPMIFMFIVSFVSLVISLVSKIKLLFGPAEIVAAQAGGIIGVVLQIIIALLLIILALFLAKKGITYFKAERRENTLTKTS